jgi:hypothetical protein
MPDNKNEGELEDLFIRYINSDIIKECVYRYIKCLEKSGKKLKNKNKSTVYSYLSSEIANSPSIGVAAQQGIFEFGNSCFDGIKDFLKKMFGVG